MAKRLVSLDTLRGLSIFAMIFVHVFVNSSIIMDTDDPFSSIPMIILFVFIFLFGHFRGFFVLISGAANLYSISAAIKKGKPVGKILSKQIGVGIFLIIFGHLKDTFINQWGILRDWFLAGGIAAENFDWASNWSRAWQYGLISEAIQSIGWCVLLTSLIYVIIIKINGVEKVKINALILFIISIVVLYIAEPLQISIVNLVGYDITSNANPWNVPVSGGFQKFLLIFAYDLVGAEAPIFPMLSYSLFGGLVGVCLTRDKQDRSFIGKGILISIGLIFWGAIDFVFRMLFQDGFEFNPTFHVHPSWYILVACGIQLMIVMITLRIYEFNPNMTAEKAKKSTFYLRRWAQLSLTIYALQILEYIPRGFLDRIFPSALLREWTESPFGFVLLFMLTNWLMWEIIIRLWEKLKMKGSFEWILLNIAKRGQKINKEDPMNMKGNLYDIEPILFLVQE